MLAGTKYTERHNNLCRYIHWCITRDIGAPAPSDWRHHSPQPTLTHEGKTLLWDTTIITDANCHNRPDIVLRDPASERCLIIDVAIPCDHNVTAKTAEKITKYTGLQIEVKKLWNIKEFRVMPIIFGALGTVSSGIGGYLKMVSPQAQFHIA